MPTLPIPSPYNFVPLSRHVFFPDWAAQVSQDVPFSDGISGWFEIEVEAMTPIFIRHGEKPREWNEKNPAEVDRLREHWLQIETAATPSWPEDDWIDFFREPDGAYAIPGSSLKGALRLVLEIASFGKFPLDGGARVLRRGDKKRGIQDILQSAIQRRSQNPDEFKGRWDLPETIFGRAAKDGAHRGRVLFEPLRAICVPNSPRPVIWPVLQTPKGMFAPNYAEQPEANEHTGWTPNLRRWTASDTRLRGWKLYPRTRTIRPCPEPPEKDDRIRWELASPMRPLPAGTRFRGRVCIHNLRPSELGALLWVMGLGEPLNSKPDARHYWLAVGGAKPFGYGSFVCTLGEKDLFRLADEARPDLAECQQAFQGQMDAFYPDGAWLNSPQLRALHSISNPDTVWPMALAYPTFADFQAYAETNNHALLPVPGVGFPAPSSLSPDEPTPPPAPPPLPDLTGQKRRVSFLRRQHFPGAAAESLVFRLKVGNEKFEARLDHPTRPELAGQLKQGASFELFVSGVADGRYLLSETDPAATPEE
jgi:hypothetical protein